MKLVAATFVALLVAQSSRVSPFEGHWRTDIPADLKSRSQIVLSGISFDVTSDTVKITQHWVSPSGRETAGEETVQTDGKPHASSSGPNWVIVAKWAKPDLLEIVDTGRGTPAVTVHRTYSVSADRKTLSLRFVYSDNGYVYERTFYRGAAQTPTASELFRQGNTR